MKKKNNDIVYEVVGCAMEVLNELGHGLREKTYERALLVEFKIRGLQYSSQKTFPVFYKGEHIDDYIPDILAEETLIVEIKTVESICDEHLGQVINYLRISGCELGLILNFRYPKLQWKRVVLTAGEIKEPQMDAD